MIYTNHNTSEHNMQGEVGVAFDHTSDKPCVSSTVSRESFGTGTLNLNCSFNIGLAFS